MYVAGISEESRMYYSTATMIIAIPTAVKIFAWTSSLVRTNLLSFEVALVIGFLTCFTFGGFTGIILSNASLDIMYHDTYYVVGHFHYVLSIAALIGVLISLRSITLSLMLLDGVQIQLRTGLLILMLAIN